jgi:hypothetical protein
LNNYVELTCGRTAVRSIGLEGAGVLSTFPVALFESVFDGKELKGIWAFEALGLVPPICLVLLSPALLLY